MSRSMLSPGEIFSIMFDKVSPDCSDPEKKKKAGTLLYINLVVSKEREY